MPKEIKIKRCKYSHCKHSTDVIDLENDEYVEENGRFFHADCKHEKDTRAEIIDYWYRNIDEDVIFNQLSKILDRLLYSEKIDCDYILFALKKKAKFLNHPPGLVYAVKDKELKKEWDFKKKLEQFNKSKVDVIKNDEPSFTYNESNSKKKFGDIFGGK